MQPRPLEGVWLVPGFHSQREAQAAAQTCREDPNLDGARVGILEIDRAPALVVVPSGQPWNTSPPLVEADLGRQLADRLGRTAYFTSDLAVAEIRAGGYTLNEALFDREARRYSPPHAEGPDREAAAPSTAHSTTQAATGAAFAFVSVAYQSVDFVRLPDGSAQRLTYDDNNPFALHSEVHAYAGEKLVGKVHWTPGYGNPAVEVAPDYQRKGIATRLLREAQASDPAATHRWTPVTRAGQALGRHLGLGDTATSGTTEARWDQPAVDHSVRHERMTSDLHALHDSPAPSGIAR